ncbi:phage portal protein [Deinococcus humi]|uniref:HK97 family phage portal protein n=1 Tax=Deinococcus humi TaxID=662880 RepID=A0A7W8JQG6_9DEIO|nr:phage portal protein [Deinococcus humi]MBB5361340.1 HK97 family phage portal protein [Deinococcus humi]GGO19543.1 hypothetical protein GCM10008949_04040 [Deinococcus humi]
MNLIQRMGAALTRKRADGPGLYAPGGIGGWWSVFQSGGRESGQVNLNDGERLQNNVGVVHVAVSRIAEDISTLPVHVERARRGGRWEEEPTHPLARLLDNPCQAHDGVSLRHVMQQHLSLLGRAALLVVDGVNGEPRELHVLYPHLLDAVPDPTGFISQYRYRTLNGQQLYFPPFTARPDASGLGVLEVRIPDPVNPYAGSSAVQAGANSITLDAEVRAYARFYFANNAMPGGVLESDQPYPGVDAAAALRESWNETYQGMYNSGKVAPLWGGLKLRSIAPAFKDLAFPEITKASRQDILMHFGVPGPVVGYTDTGALGADTFSAAQAVYQAQTLDPHRKRMERLFNRLSVRFPGVRVRIESPVEEDLAALEKRQLDELKTGAISREEYRAARGYEPDGQPNVWMVPGSLNIRHDLKPQDAEPPPEDQPPDEPPSPARYRQMWAEEYRLLKNAPDPQAAARTAQERWEALGSDVAARAMQHRRAALTASGGDLALAYEALKAEAKALYVPT